jgi:hypothetical protein
LGRHPSKYISVVGTRKIYNWVENMGLIEKNVFRPPFIFLGYWFGLKKGLKFCGN